MRRHSSLYATRPEGKKKGSQRQSFQVNIDYLPAFQGQEEEKSTKQKQLKQVILRWFQLRNQLVFDSGHQVVFLISMVRDFPYQNQSKISMVPTFDLSFTDGSGSPEMLAARKKIKVDLLDEEVQRIMKYCTLIRLVDSPLSLS